MHAFQSCDTEKRDMGLLRDPHWSRMFFGKFFHAFLLYRPAPQPVSSSLDRATSPDAERVSSGQPDADWGLIASGVRLIALRALGDPALADDVAQEAVTRAIASLASQRSAPVLDHGAFVYGIARHLIADAHRKQGRHVPLDAIGEPSESSPDALVLLIIDAEHRALRAALQTLSDSDRRLLRLFFVDGLTAEEIGVRLGEAAVNIRKRKSRALGRLRQAFGGADAGHDSTRVPTE